MGAKGERYLWRGLAGVGLVTLLPLLYAWAAGATSIPHNDDWAFLRILFHLVRTGELQLVGWNEMVLLGHLVWAFPLVRLFGEHIALLDTAVSLWSAAGAVLVGVLARRFVSDRQAVFVAALVAVFPGFVQTSVSYMTDPVALVAQVGCILLGIAAIRSDDENGRTLFIYSMALGLFAFTIREFSLLAPLAVGTAAIATEIKRKRIRFVTAGSIVLFIAAAASIYMARQSLPGGTPHTFGAPGGQRLLILVSQSIFTLGLALSPVLAILIRRRPEGLLGCMNGGALLGLALAALTLQNSGDITTCCFKDRSSAFVGNALTNAGMLGNSVLDGIRPPAFPAPMWLLLTALGIASGALVMGWLWASFKHWLRAGADLAPESLILLLWGAGTGAAMVMRAALGGPLFDRYLVVPVVVAAIFALRATPDPADSPLPKSALAAFALLVVTSASLVTNGLNFDVARWEAGRMSVADGIPATAIDAGFEWVGYHYEGVAEEPLPPVSQRWGPGYMDAFPAAGNCIIVAASPVDIAEWELIREVPYEGWFGLANYELWVYRNDPACAALGLS